MNPVKSPAGLAAAVVLATTGGLLTTAVIAAPTASAATTCTSPVYTRQLFANTTFSGTAKQTGCDAAIDENWGTRAPASGLPSNNFGVRWTVTRDFGSGGPFAFTAAVQDGLRVYVDGVRKVDLWKNGSATVSKTVNLTVPAGKHTLRVDYVNWTGKANVKFGYTPRTSASVDKVRPLTPTGLTATYDRVTARAKFTWAKNKEMDLGGYRIYRRPVAGTTWTQLASTTATAYTDTALPATGEAYAYQLLAFDRAGNDSAGRARKTITTVDRTALATPTDLEAFSLFSGVLLQWSKVADAASYRLYRAASPQGAYSRIGTTSEGWYDDASAVEGATYYYRVTSLDAAGNESTQSAPLSATHLDHTPPPAVTGLTVSPTEYGFELRWDANPTADLAGYWIRWGKFYGREGAKECHHYDQFDVPADTTSYAYTVLPDGEDACFLIGAIDEAGNYSPTGEARTVRATALDMTPSVPTPEGSPLTLTATGANGDEGNHLSWSGLDASAPEQAGGYRVHRWNPATSAYERIAELPSGTIEFHDKDVPRGTTSFYWVTAVSADGTETTPSGDYAATAPDRRNPAVTSGITTSDAVAKW